MRIDAAERLIVALDVPHNPRDENHLIEPEDARRLVEFLDGVVSFFKIGWPLYMAGGQDLPREFIGRGKRVFLDLKFGDIAETVRRLILVAAKDGVSFLTVNTSFDAIRAAVAARPSTDLKILTVTVLTSLDDTDLREMGDTRSVLEGVRLKTIGALQAGCDGVIASGAEASMIRSIAGEKFLIVTPGIRPAGEGRDDHKRAVSPTASIRGGADYLVVGGPITRAKDPRMAAQDIIREMQQAFDARGTP